MRYFKVAKDWADWSKDPSTKIGAVSVCEIGDDPISHGYNGFPRGIKDTPERLENREVKYKLVVHGEHNCILNAGRKGVPLKGSKLFVYGLPVCHQCAGPVIQSGITEVYMQFGDVPDRWKDSYDLAIEMFDEVGIKYHLYDLSGQKIEKIG